MGGGDSEDKDALSNALDLAWKEWTKDVTSMGAVQERSTTTRETPVKESDDQNDEDNGEDLESDREVVASDDDGDGIDEGRLMVDHLQLKPKVCPFLSTAGVIAYICTYAFMQISSREKKSLISPCFRD